MSDNIKSYSDPVFLSGGDLGGTIVEGSGWEMNEERIFEGLVYRRAEKDDNPESQDQVVFCGKAK